MKQKLSVIIPAYNEEKRIKNTLENYCKSFRNKNLEFEILVVLNACKDETFKIVKNSQKEFKEIKFMNLDRGGKGFAIIEGFKDSLKRENNLIGFVDADMATSPEAFYDLVKNIKDYDGIIASRWKKDSIIKTEQSLLRKITSRGFNFLIKSLLFLPYSDTQCGAKLFKRNVLKKVLEDIKVTKWAFDVDLLYLLKRNGFRIKEIPTIWEDKAGSKLNLIKVPFQMFSAIVRLRLVYSPFKFIIRIYDKLPERIKVHNW